MPTEIDISKFAATVRTKRGDRGLREAAAEIGDVSASTLSRIEQNQVPDLTTFFRLCDWLQMAPADFVTGAPKQELKLDTTDVPAVVEAQLRADRTLPRETIDALAKMIQLAYKAVEQDKLPSPKKKK